MRRNSHGILAALALCGALALSAAAQTGQTSTTTADQQATTPAQNGPAQNTTTSAAEQNDVNQANQVSEKPLVMQTRQGFWGRVNPFARKKYVKTQLQPIQDRVNELDQLTSSNANLLQQVDQQTKAGIADAQSRANAANEQAENATQQAQQDASQASQLDQQVATVQSNLQGVDQYQVAQTAELDFRPGSTRLNPTAQQSLDQFLNGLEGQKGYVIEVQGYAAGSGLRAMQESQRLADSVVRYLVLQHNVPLFRIYTMGMGNTPAPVTSAEASAPARLTRGGRVDIRILRNSLANSGSTQTSGAGNEQ